MEVSRAWRKSPLLTRGVEKSNLLHRHYILSLLVCNGQVALDRFYQRVNMCIVSGGFQVDLKKEKKKKYNKNNHLSVAPGVVCTSPCKQE